MSGPRSTSGPGRRVARAGALLLGLGILAAGGVFFWRTRHPAGRPPDPAPAVAKPGSMPSAVAAEPAAEGPASPLFHDDPRHPWNGVHHALFSRRVQVSRALCLSGTPGAGPCAHLPFPGMPPLGEAAVTEGGDTATLLLSHDVQFLTRGARRTQVLAALVAARTVPPQQDPVAAALLQGDLWERFDSLHTAETQQPEGPVRAALREVRDEVGRTLRALALPAATLRALPGNLAELSASYPALLGGLEAPEGWLEVVTRSADRPEPMAGAARDGTRHAEMSDYRVVFRRLVSVPEAQGGGAWLRSALHALPGRLALPEGSRMILLALPFAVSTEGALVALPLVTLIEERVVPPAGAAVRTLADLPVFVFEGRRPWLRQQRRTGGGLELLPPEHPFPHGGSCMPDPSVLLPVAGSCQLCHGPSHHVIEGSRSHGAQQQRLEDDAQVQVRAATERKQARPDFAALQAYFR